MSSEKCVGVIPARYQSVRLPGKPLVEIAGKSLIQRTWEQASKAVNLSEVIIATDDERIKEAAEKFQAHVLMTDPNHQSGSDRVAEVVQILKKEGQDFDLVVNIQGDMPFVNPEIIDRTVGDLMAAGPQFEIGTTAVPITDEEEFLRTSDVKVVLADNNAALYFSRSPIPCHRDREKLQTGEQEVFGLKHVGLYVFRTESLLKYTSLPQAFLEKTEKLEQLRALANGMQILVTVVTKDLMQPSIEVDTPEDLERANREIPPEFV